LKISKKLTLLLVVVLSMSLFTGCTGDEKALSGAMMKSQEILSMKSTTDLNFSLNSTGLSGEEQVAFDNVATMINGLQVTLKQKSQADKDLFITKAQVDASIKLEDMTFDSTVWVDLDLNDENFTFREIFKLPSILSMNMPAPMNEKEYLVLDFGTMSEIDGDMVIPMDYSKTIAISMDYQEKFVSVFQKYINNIDSNLISVTKLQDQVINEQDCQMYQIQMDDASFKQFIQQNIINLLQDEEMLALFKDYMTESLSATGETMPEEMDFTKNIPELLVKTNEFFEAFKDVTILGEDGIVIEYGINQDGFIISEVGKMDFKIDVQQLANSINTLSGLENDLPIGSKPIINFGISYDSKITNINEEIEVTMPVLTEENSIDFMSMMNSLMPAPPTQSAIIFVDDMYLDLENEPQFINNRIFVPVREVSNALGADVAWDQSTKEATISKGDTKLLFTVGSDIAIKNGEAVTLDSKVIVANGSAIVPLRFLCESFGYQINWTPDSRMIEISIQE